MERLNVTKKKLFELTKHYIPFSMPLLKNTSLRKAPCCESYWLEFISPDSGWTQIYLATCGVKPMIRIRCPATSFDQLFVLSITDLDGFGMIQDCEIQEENKHG